MQENKKQKKYHLTLYIAGMTTSAERALANLKKIAESYMEADYEIEVVDLMVTPEAAEQAQIIAVPTLVRKLPQPLRKVIGDLSNEEKVLIGLDLKTRSD